MKKVILVVGPSGVGKTSILNEVLNKEKDNVDYINYGSEMFEIAKEYGVDSRDKIRKLNKKEYYNIFYKALEKIKKKIENSQKKIVLLDTHILIDTKFGTFIGTPKKVVEELKFDGVVVITAKPEEIVERAKKDNTRKRDDLLDVEKIKKRLDLTLNTAFIVAYETHALFKEIVNKNGELEKAVKEFVDFIEWFK